MQTQALKLSQTKIRLNAVIKNVYRWMAGGLSLTAAVSFYITTNERLMERLLANRLTFILLIVAQIALVFTLSARIHRMSVPAATLGFMTYALLNGVTLAPIFLIYTKTSIVSTFLITAGLFGAMSIWAMVTKADLSSWRPYLLWGLVGVIGASIINWFLRSSALNYLISAIGVVLFMGLTAYDTKKIHALGERMEGRLDETNYVRLSILGALKLYLDFINLFLFLLRFVGRRN